MFVSKKTWASYGIKTVPEESYEMHNFVSVLNHLLQTSQAYLFKQEQFAQRSANPEPSLIVNTSPTPSAAWPSETPSLDSNQATTTFTAAVPAAPPAASTTSTPQLSTAAIAGVCTAVSIIVVLIAYVVLEICVLRKRRRGRAMRRAVAEVEQGSVRSDSIRSEVKSREGFVMDEKEKGEVVVGEEEVWEVEEGRKGMSLPRRFW